MVLDIILLQKKYVNTQSTINYLLMLFRNSSSFSQNYYHLVIPFGVDRGNDGTQKFLDRPFIATLLHLIKSYKNAFKYSDFSNNIPYDNFKSQNYIGSIGSIEC